jgi:hypothetical protein
VDVAAGIGGFKIQGENADDLAGWSVSAAGDVNGDGLDDLIVGAEGEDDGGHYAGAAYVVFGSIGGFASAIDLGDIASGIGGFKIQGENAGDRAGGSVSAAGDVNGDGIDDLIVGAAGAAYVLFGSAGPVSPLPPLPPSPFPAVVDLGDIAAGSGGFRIQGENAHDSAGSSVSTAGDINGDGIDDLIVGVPQLYPSAGTGAAYVVFGRADGFSSPLDLAGIAAGTGGFKIQGENAGDGAGGSVSAAGDVNGDGIADLIVGVRGDDGSGVDAGAAYVVFGRAGGFTSPLDLADVAAGRGGFKIQGEDDDAAVGASVSDAGDVNGDGIDDLIVGTFGNVYVVFGRTDGFTNPVDLASIAAGTGGLRIQSVSGLGFVTGMAYSCKARMLRERLCGCGGRLPIRRGFPPEEAQRAAGDQVALQVEGIVDGGMDRQEALGRPG